MRFLEASKNGAFFSGLGVKSNLAQKLCQPCPFVRRVAT